jgi:hypothetical protein
MAYLLTRKPWLTRSGCTIAAAQSMAEERLARMEKILDWIDEESFGEL